MPPTFAANGTASIRALIPLSSALTEANTGAIMDSIITVVAVLLMNMAKNPVTHITPSMTRFGFLPNGLSSTLARFMSSLYLVEAMARAKPPRNRMITGELKLLKMDL